MATPKKIIADKINWVNDDFPMIIDGDAEDAMWLFGKQSFDAAKSGMTWDEYKTKVQEEEAAWEDDRENGKV